MPIRLSFKGILFLSFNNYQLGLNYINRIIRNNYGHLNFKIKPDT